MNATVGRFALALALAAGAAACGPKAPPERPAVKEPAYVFPHSTHVDADVACTNCHQMERATSLDASVRHVRIPVRPSRQQECKDCHDTDPALKIPTRARAFRLTLDHAAHLPRVNRDCKRCHLTQPEAGATEAKPPPMAACTSCHNHQQDFAETRCARCHKDLRGYKPETAFAHAGDWLRTHGTLARTSADTCASCHDQTYCSECHSPQTAPGRPSIVFPERVDRAYIHRGDYVSRHMIEAGANPASCRKCHGPAFCQACHEVQGLSQFAATPYRKPPSHDQAGWATPAAGGARPLHASAARRDISSCAGCHDQGAQATCVGCHRVGGFANSPPYGTNPNGPHPSSFVSKHRGEDKSKNSMCAACHL